MSIYIYIYQRAIFTREFALQQTFNLYSEVCSWQTIFIPRCVSTRADALESTDDCPAAEQDGGGDVDAA